MKNAFSCRLVAGTCLAALATAGMVSTVYAQDAETVELDEILVTTGAEPLPTKRVASSFTIIDQQDIEQQQYRTLVDALNSVPGLSVVQSGGVGTQTSVFMRGANSNQTLVLLDGHDISDPSSPNGAFDFANFRLEDVQRIEVVRGPQSGRYGSQAIGGVINIITKTGKGAPTVNMRAEGGTLGTANVAASVGGGLGGLGYLATFDFADTNGSDITPARLRGGVEEEKDGNTEYTGSLKLNGDLNETLEASAFVQYSHSKTDLDAETPEDLDNYTENDEVLANAAIAGAFLDGKYRPKLSGSYTWYDRKNIDEPDYITPTVADTRYKGYRATARFDNTYDVSEMLILNGGASYKHESFESSGYQLFSGGYRLDSASDANANEYAIFGSADMNQDLGAIETFGMLSLRYDMPVDFDNKFTFTVAPGFELKETGTRFTGSFGTAFKTPSLYQRFGFQPNSYGGAYFGNNELEPEESWGFDVGFEQELAEEEVSFGATYFNNYIKNGIPFDRIFLSMGTHELPFRWHYFTQIFTAFNHFRFITLFILGWYCPRLSSQGIHLQMDSYRNVCRRRWQSTGRCLVRLFRFE